MRRWLSRSESPERLAVYGVASEAEIARVIERALRSCRVEDAPMPLIHEDDIHHVAYMVTVAVLERLEQTGGAL